MSKPATYLLPEDLDNLVGPSKQHEFQKNHCAFVRRSDGTYTYAVCRKTSRDGLVTFAVSPSGNVKKIPRSKCHGLVKIPLSVAQTKQKKSSRTFTSRSLDAKEGPAIRVHRSSSSLPPNKALPYEAFARSDLSLFEGQVVKNGPVLSKKELTASKNQNIANHSDTEHLVSDAAICSQIEVDDELKKENRMLKKQVKHLQRLLEQRIEMKFLGQSHSSPETDTTDELELEEYEACQDGMDLLCLEVLNQRK